MPTRSPHPCGPSLTATARPAIGVLVVDAGPAFRAAAERLLDSMPDFVLAGVAGTGDAAVELVDRHGADLALVDVRMRGMEGLETTRRLRRLAPTLVVVLMSVEDPLQLPSEVGFCGASDVVRKQDLSPPLLRRLWETHRSAER